MHIVVIILELHV